MRFRTNNKTTIAAIIGATGIAFALETAAATFTTNFSNVSSIANTRHNLTQSTSSNPASQTFMNPYRNNYGEVCVYCHTPHGANSQINAPLWNRTFNNEVTYTTYDQLGTSSLTASVAQPGVNSITCLSCHDGTLAMDSIINMPGSGLYDASQETGTSADDAWLDRWDGASGADLHYGFNAGSSECMICHNGALEPAAPDFRIAWIGTDLTNDHPIGIDLPVGRIGDDFYAPTGTANGLTYYNNPSNGADNGRADKNEIRFYDTGSGPRVECASCHDPHGVSPDGTLTTQFNPTFLRIPNDASAVCLTCHDK